MPKPTNPFSAGMKAPAAAPPKLTKPKGGPKVKSRPNKVVINKTGY